MEIPIWFIYSILACLSIGIYTFSTKVQAESKYDDFYFYFFIYLTLLMTFPYLIFKEIEFFNLKIIFFSFIMSFSYFFVLKTRFISLKHISSSTYFINYRILSSIFLLISGIVLFDERIRISDYFGIFIGFIVFYLLFEKKEKNESLKNLKKGIIFLFLGIILISFNQTFYKYISCVIHRHMSLYKFYQIHLTKSLKTSLGVLLSKLKCGLI